MTTGGNGHVFVVRGRIENLDHDAVVVPTDQAFSVKDIWHGVLGSEGAPSPAVVESLRPEEWHAKRWGRAGDPSVGASAVWFVDVAAYADAGAPTDQVSRMLMRVEAVLADIAADELPAGRGRPRPLVALPTLGVGGGGFGGEARGAVVRGLFAVCERAAADHGIDIAVVAFRASDYSAFQHERRASGTHAVHLGDDRLQLAKDLAGRARDGSLALFVGAGVSVGAGLPGWKELLSGIAGAEKQEELEGLDSVLDQAELLKRRLGDDLGRRVATITSGVKRYALAHSLLASLGCREAVTTNYDSLYERAARDAGENVVPVLPFQDAVPSAPWLLKMHGDEARPKTIVLSRSDFVGYDSDARPMGSIVQTLLLTRHLLVVGASMTDDNFLRLAHEVIAFRHRSRSDEATTEPVGTVVTLTPSPLKAELWEGRFTYQAATDADASISEAARLLAIFLDAVAMYATPAGHLADKRYSYLLPEADQQVVEKAHDLAAALEGASPEWAPLSQALESLGITRA